MSIGSELKRYRELSFLTQRRLGELLGYQGRCAELSVQQWEYDKRLVPLKHFRKLHQIIGIPYEKLIP